MKQIIRGGRVLTAGRLDGGYADILIDGGAILAILPAGEPVTEDALTVDASRRLLIPGLVNSHTHATVHLAKGLADRWSLELLLNAYPMTAGGKTLEHKYLSAYIGAVEMVRKGCTACYDLAAELPAPSQDGIEAVARAYHDVGLRAVIAPMMADTSFYQAIPGLLDAMPPDLRARAEAIRMQPYETSLETCRAIIDKWPWDREKIMPALGPTIPHHCSDGFLTGCRDMAKEYGLGIQMHVAESKIQALTGVKRYGSSLVGHLDELGLLGPNFTAAHAIWLDEDDIKRLADAGVTVAHNPGSNFKLGSGIAATGRFRANGLTFGLGTDGCLSSDNLNMFEAMRLAAFGSRVQGPDPRDWLTAANAFEAATIGGARALGLERSIGRLEAGFRADVVFLDLTNVNYIPLNDPLLNLVFCEDATGVDRVMIDGRTVVEGGQVTGVNMTKLADNAAEAVERLRAVNAAAKGFVEMLEPVVLDFCVGLASQPHHVHRWCGHEGH